MYGKMYIDLKVDTEFSVTFKWLYTYFIYSIYKSTLYWNI